MKVIVGVPETITHAQVIAAAELLGFDPKVVRSIRIGTHFVEVVLYATTPVRLLRDQEPTDVPATHTICYDLDEAKPPVDDN